MKYTRKQICEAIKHWQKQLKKMDESVMADGGPWWILVGVSNLSENYFIKTFDSQEEALADARELIDFSSGYPCDPKNERRRFDTADKALEFLKTTGSLRITDRLSYGDDIKLFEVTEPMIEKIFNMN